MRPRDLNCYDDPEDEQAERAPVDDDYDEDMLNPWSWLNGCHPFGEDPYDGIKFSD